MTRDSRAWRWIGFLIALVGVGFPYWQLAPEQAGLPRALYGPGLVAVGVIAMLLRAFGRGRFLTLWLLLAPAPARRWRTWWSASAWAWARRWSACW